MAANQISPTLLALSQNNEILPPHLASQPRLVGIGCIYCVKVVSHVDDDGVPDGLDIKCRSFPYGACQYCRTVEQRCTPPPARWRRAFNILEVLLQDYQAHLDEGPDSERAYAAQGYAATLRMKWEAYTRRPKALRDELEKYNETDEYAINWQRYKSGREYGGLGKCYPMNEVVDEDVEMEALNNMSTEEIRKFWLDTA